MKLLLATVAILASLGCSGAESDGFGFDFRPKLKSGIYQSLEKTEFLVSSSGPAALSVQGPDNLCLMFWRPNEETRVKDPIIRNSKHVMLLGQKCGKNGPPDLDWRAMYSGENLAALIIAPPEVFSGDAKPSELRFVREGRWNR